MGKNLNYGIIGNCQSAALVSENGSIDWCCLPEPDSPALFARILDEEKGGHFAIYPDGNYILSQKYYLNTNILITTFTGDSDAFEIIDFMPRYKIGDNNYYNSPEIYRIIKVLNGKPVIRVDYNPKPNFASSKVRHDIKPDYIKSYTTTGRYESIYLYSSLEKKQIIVYSLKYKV